MNGVRTQESCASHTPGPWSCAQVWREPNTKVHVEFEGRRVALAEVFTMHTAGEREANAHLIAAAPELLALAQKLAGECAECSGRGYVFLDDGITGFGPDDREPTREHCAECADIREVIAKAEQGIIAPDPDSELQEARGEL